MSEITPSAKAMELVLSEEKRTTELLIEHLREQCPDCEYHTWKEHFAHAIDALVVSENEEKNKYIAYLEGVNCTISESLSERQEQFDSLFTAYNVLKAEVEQLREALTR